MHSAEASKTLGDITAAQKYRLIRQGQKKTWGA